MGSVSVRRGVCISSNVDVSFSVALAVTVYFSWWLPYCLSSNDDVTREWGSRVKSCHGVWESEGEVMPACICTRSLNVSGREVTSAVFPKQVTSGLLAFSAKSMNEKHVLLQVCDAPGLIGISGNPGFFYFPSCDSRGQELLVYVVWGLWPQYSYKCIFWIGCLLFFFFFFNSFSLPIFGVSYGAKYLLSVILWPCYLLSCTFLIHYCLQDFLSHSVVGDCGLGLTNVGAEVW